MQTSIPGLLMSLLILLSTTLSFSEPKIAEKQVEYTAQGAGMKSYLAYDESRKEKRPGVLVVPEWWGLNDYARKRARMLAELGYTALAVDIYGGGKQAATPEEAGRLSSEVMKDFEKGIARFESAMGFLNKHPTVDSGLIAAIGYCFGGGVVVNMAGQGMDLKGVVSFHGSLNLVRPPKAGKIKARVLVLTGKDDPLVPPDQVERFEREMKAAGADVRVISYPGATHSFTNPEADALGKKFKMPVAYNAEADKRSWDEMRGFLTALFKK